MKEHKYGKATLHRYGAYRQCLNCDYQSFSERDLYITKCPVNKYPKPIKDLKINYLEDK